MTPICLPHESNSDNSGSNVIASVAFVSKWGIKEIFDREDEKSISKSTVLQMAAGMIKKQCPPFQIFHMWKVLTLFYSSSYKYTGL